MKKFITFAVLILFFLSVRPVLAAPLTLSDYWQGKAVWKPVFTIPNDLPGWIGGFENSAQVVVVGNNWYLFTRHVDWSPKPDYCPQNKITLAVSKSTDNGKTWTIPVDILTNTLGTYQECAAVDGGAYYQQSTNIWHILYQCLDRNSKWNTCHASKIGPDPIGQFDLDNANPVIHAGTLWGKICNSPQDKCVSEATGPSGKIVEEGTFDIVYFDGQYFWVSFHGFDGEHFFRGIAKTADFHTFVADDPSQEVPTDSIINPSDLLTWNVTWNGPPDGVGASRTINEDGMWYQFIEGGYSDWGGWQNGYPKQQWDWGIFRSSSLSSIHWEQPTAFRNPVISQNPAVRVVDWAANPAYGGIFRDSAGKLYMEITQSGFLPKYAGIFFFSLFNPADIDQNGKVDIFDYNQLVTDFDQTGSHSNLSLIPFVPSDINNDDKVDIFDYNQLVGNFGK